jgi:N-acetylneuraminate synthase/N,N'-diacetyllegionaminate synthase
MKIGCFDLAERPFLIAEIGNNHEGNPDLAVKLVDAAVAAGADAVKVQLINPLRLVNRSEAQRIAQLSRFRLERDVFLELARRVREKGALFMASAFDCDTLEDWADDLDAVKIASGDLDFDPMLQAAARCGKPVVLSTGMSTLPEIERAVGVFSTALPPGVAAKDRLAVLHCVSLYPAPLALANLSAIAELRERLGLTIGYSDHTLGVTAATMALGLGARVIEKHFTLDKAYSEFRDHALSAEPAEFAVLAEAVRSFKDILGRGFAGGELADAATRAVARRGIVAAREIAAGDTITAADLDYVRPATGFPPSAAEQVIGRQARKPLALHQVLREEDLA